MTNIDLKLLAVFDEIYKTRSVSQAAENLGLSQPGISMSLNRLRKHFNDALFVRTTRGMEPTPHAEALIKFVREAQGLLQMALGHQVIFDPATSDRMFRLCTTDIGQLVIMPKILRHFAQVAPAIRLELVNISDRISMQLESGEVDLAVGFVAQLDSGFYQQKLFDEKFVCVVRAGHPRVRERLTLAQFREEPHAVVTTSGTGHGILERTLDALGIRRKIALRVPNFLGVAAIVSNTDVLVTVPERLAETMADVSDIQVFPTPFEMPPYLIKQHWHERYTNDPGLRWFRGAMANLFTM